MERFDNAIATFGHALDRARQMVTLYDALSTLRPGFPANDDALRSAYFQTVSSFDFFVHELAAIEAMHRFRNGIRTKRIHLPMELMTIDDIEERITAAEIKIRETNSYRAFVDPSKLSDLLCCYCADPWEKIRARVNIDLPAADQKSVHNLKGQLKSIWKRRNQIAHEADVNPELAGIGLWPINKEDTQITIDFIGSVGMQIPFVIAEVTFSDAPEDELPEIFG